jgi:large subunit ribosomal protein L15
MVVRRDKKAKKLRAKTTHGYGSMKKNRGAGNKGGKGKAGSGKRGDAKKPSFWKGGALRKGKSGFKSKGIKTKTVYMTLKQLEASLPVLVEKKFATLDKDVYSVDLKKAGCTKLLGNGEATKKMQITVGSASQTAIDKVTEAGGAVTAANAGEE